MATFSQYTTLFEAASVAAVITGQGIGGGTLSYNPDTVHEYQPPDPYDSHRSGIYIPEYNGGPFPTPTDGMSKFYHLRFRNGAEGINAGLAKSIIEIYTVMWPVMIGGQVNAEAKNNLPAVTPAPIITLPPAPKTQVLMDQVIGAYDPNWGGYEPAPGTNPIPGTVYHVSTNGMNLVARQMTTGFLGIIRWYPQ